MTTISRDVMPGRRWPRAAAWVLLLGTSCDMSHKLDPQGYLCDPGGQCPDGYQCVESVCTKADPCATMACLEAPAASCTASTARVFTGRCSSGTCVYQALETPCAAGCNGEVCQDACLGVACVSPPEASCVTGTRLRTYPPSGVCLTASGTCTYAPTEQECPKSCENGRCKDANLCALVACDASPGVLCVGTTLRTYAASGTCDPGTGSCAYQHTEVACPNGCQEAACVPLPLGFRQVGPQVRFAVNAVDVDPTGGRALAVGNAGRVAQWTAAGWAELATPSASDLHSVHFASAAQAFVAGSNRALWSWTGALTAVPLPGSNPGANLVSVFARSEASVLVADDTGEYWVADGGGWLEGRLPSDAGVLELRAASIDERGFSRIVGRSGGKGCVAIRAPAWTEFKVDLRADAGAYQAIGGSFAPASSATPEVLLGDSVSDLLTTHSTVPPNYFGTLAVSAPLEGSGVLAIAAQGGAASRPVFVLTSSAGGAGHLYLVEKGMPASALPVLDTFSGQEVMSVNASDAGVLVAEVNRLGGANTIFRHTGAAQEALDVGADLAGVSTAPNGAFVAVTNRGDLALRAPGASTWAFHRPKDVWTVRAVEARNGATVLLAGKSGASDGVLYRFTPGAGFSKILTHVGTAFSALCRVSESEGWAVGTQGVIYSVTSTGVAQLTSPSTKDLTSVDCGPGKALACGVGGTVLEWNGIRWANVEPSLPTAVDLVACRLVGGKMLVGGDNVLFRHDGQSWAALPARVGLTMLVARAVNDVYGAAVTHGSTMSDPGASAVFRFDGASWGPALVEVPAVLRNGVLTAGGVLVAGTGGALVEGK